VSGVQSSTETEQAATALYEFVTLAVRELSSGREPSRTAVSVLSSLDGLGPLRVTTLATREGVTQPSMTQLVRRLMDRGYVALTVDATDARARLVAITETGRTVLAERRRGSHERLAALLAELPPEQATALAAAVGAALPTLRQRAAQPSEAGGLNHPTYRRTTYRTTKSQRSE
jgi:DNA-binding MarR family transcriptional regulator